MNKFDGNNDGCLGLIIGSLLGALVNAYILKMGLDGILGMDVPYIYAWFVIIAIKGRI